MIVSDKKFLNYNCMDCLSFVFYSILKQFMVKISKKLLLENNVREVYTKKNVKNYIFLSCNETEYGSKVPNYIISLSRRSETNCIFYETKALLYGYHLLINVPITIFHLIHIFISLYACVTLWCVLYHM